MGRDKLKSIRTCREVIFPVNRIHKILRDSKLAENVGKGAAVYIAAIMEYLTTEILCLAATATEKRTRTRILPRHIQAAVLKDVELIKLFTGVTFAQGN